MARQAIAPSPTGLAGDAAVASARLALVESFQQSDDRDECVRLAVDWLTEHGGARSAICALIDPASGELRGAAGAGVPSSQVARLAVPHGEPLHPLSFALSRKFAVVSAGGNGKRAPAPALFGGRGFVAVAMPMTFFAEPRQGILLASPPSPRLQREAGWVADLLGQKLVFLRTKEKLAEAEERLAREREMFATVINSVPDPILLTDIEGRILFSNARADALFVAKEDVSEGRHRAVSLNNMLFSAALSRQAIESGAGTRKELLLVDPVDGSDLLFEPISATAEHAREGTRIASLLRNVTDLRAAGQQIEENFARLRLAEADVRAERDRLDLVIDSVADPILVSDPAGKILFMNPPAERLFAAAKSWAEDGQAPRAVRANDAHFSSFVSNLLLSREERRWRGEFLLTDPETGKPLPVEAISGKVLSAHGELAGIVTILHDRTEVLEKARLYEQLKQASEKLEQKVREATAELLRRNELLERQHIELEHASQLKSQFLANMSHEFRTPLNAILGYTRMLLNGVNGDLSATQRKNLTRVDSNAKHLLGIINDFLDISRIEAGKMPLHVDEFELPTLVGEVLAEVEPLIERAHLGMETDLPVTLPALVTDRKKVKQILLNFLTNAVKFTPRGTVKVSAAFDDEADQVAISVHDTGIGIAEKDQEKVFEDFRQADNSVTRQYGGAGLGLSICRRLANMLEGKILLKSQLGQGSTFTLVLPRRGGRRVLPRRGGRR